MKKYKEEIEVIAAICSILGITVFGGVGFLLNKSETTYGTAVHTRDEMNHLIKAFEEMVRVMKGSGARMEISHIKSLGPSNWGIVAGILKRMDELSAEGYDIGFDQYPWDAGSAGMKVMIPGWAYSGGVDKFEERLKAPATKA